MVIERLGNPKKFARVTEAVNGLPAPPARSGIPAESARAPACLRLLASARAGVNADATQLRLPTDANLR